VGKLVVLRIGEGSFAAGFPVTVQIGEEADRPSVEIQGKLPPNLDIAEHYVSWQATYYNLGLRSRLHAPAGQVTNVSVIEDCDNAAHRLHNSLNHWLQSEPFRPVRERLLEKLQPADEIRFILQVELPQLQRLPWHLWDLLDRYPKAELAISAPVYERIPHPVVKHDRVKILAVLGDSRGIDTQADRALLAQLTDAEVTFLVEPPRKTLTDQLWEQDWDILFFAGHSASQGNGEVGRMYLNQSDSLTINQLKFALRRAVERGLKLTIFNSCDGLGLARELADLQIPEIIVMREPVPDRVAQEFLKYFLTAFAQDTPFYLAVREARERLQGLEDQFPCATWLPVICQNPAEPPPTWRTLTANAPTAPSAPATPTAPRLPQLRLNLRHTLFTSLLVAGTIAAIRYLGVLQPLELKAFDQMMRLRPNEGVDSRLLVITVTEDDIQTQRQNGEELRGISLSDRTLSRLLEVLQSYQPRVIGLDLYRDFRVAPGQAKLATQLSQISNLIGICKASDRQTDTRGFDPPPEIPAERLGFSDFIADADQVVRRQLLFMAPEPASPCPADYAFSTQLALQYLAQEKIYPTFTPDGNLQLGSTVFHRIQSRTGAYQGIDAAGSQILMNYRSVDQVANSVTVGDVLAGRIHSDAVKGKIVLIGVITASAGDAWSTPYTIHDTEKTPGVFVQADMTSQILSAVIDRRSLLQTLPPFAELSWIVLWSIAGGIVAWWQRSRPRLILTIVLTTAVLYGVCFGILLKSVWIPWVPAAIGLLIASGIVMLYQKRIKDEGRDEG
jgi:CHASE2 domain-containing sensor protein